MQRKENLDIGYKIRIIDPCWIASHAKEKTKNLLWPNPA